MRARNKKGIKGKKINKKYLCSIIWKVGEQVKVLEVFGRRLPVPYPKLKLKEFGWSGWLAPCFFASPLLVWTIQHGQGQSMSVTVS